LSLNDLQNHYFVLFLFMSKNTQQAEATPGVDDAISQAINPTRVKEYLTKDLSIAISCLNAIQSDPDLLDHIAHFMAGRWANAKHKPKD